MNIQTGHNGQIRSRNVLEQTFCIFTEVMLFQRNTAGMPAVIKFNAWLRFKCGNPVLTSELHSPPLPGTGGKYPIENLPRLLKNSTMKGCDVVGQWSSIWRHVFNHILQTWPMRKARHFTVDTKNKSAFFIKMYQVLKFFLHNVDILMNVVSDCQIQKWEWMRPKWSRSEAESRPFGLSLTWTPHFYRTRGFSHINKHLQELNGFSPNPTELLYVCESFHSSRKYSWGLNHQLDCVDKSRGRFTSLRRSFVWQVQLKLFTASVKTDT